MSSPWMMKLTLAAVVTVALIGCGGSKSSSTSAPSPTPTPTPSPNAASFSFSPKSVDFGSVTSGTTKNSPISMTNTGTASVTVTQLQLSSGSFSITGFSVPVTLNANSTVSGTITFAPSGTGAISASLTALDNLGALGTASLIGTATAATGHLVDVTWVASSSTVTGYNIYRSTVSGGPYAKVGTATGTIFTDSTVKAGTTYFYVVTSVNASSVESPTSAEVVAAVPTP